MQVAGGGLRSGQGPVAPPRPKNSAGGAGKRSSALPPDRGMLQDTQNTVTHAELTLCPQPYLSVQPRSTSPTYAQGPVGLDFGQRLAVAPHYRLSGSLTVCHGYTLQSPFSARGRGEAPKLALSNHVHGQAKTLPQPTGFAPAQTPPCPSPRSTPAWARPAHASSPRHTCQGPPKAVRPHSS